MKLVWLMLMLPIALACQGGCLNDRPIIGVMAQETQGMDAQYGRSYIAASYVKYLEAAGARVVPILLGRPTRYYLRLADSLNGLLFPGGEANILHSHYGSKGWILYNAILRKNYMQKIYFPIWGTSLGFELLMYYGGNRKTWSKTCYAQDMAVPLQFTGTPSRMISALSQEVRAALGREDLTINHHEGCMTPENFSLSGLNLKFNVISTNRDYKGLEFISTVENYKFPIYATSWHPEKNQFEFATRIRHSNNPHSPNAIRVGQEFANFFVNEARKNSQTFRTPAVEKRHLIYNYQPRYVGKDDSEFEQNYYFS